MKKQYTLPETTAVFQCPRRKVSNRNRLHHSAGGSTSTQQCHWTNAGDKSRFKQNTRGPKLHALSMIFPREINPLQTCLPEDSCVFLLDSNDSFAMAGSLEVQPPFFIVRFIIFQKEPPFLKWWLTSRHNGPLDSHDLLGGSGKKQLGTFRGESF